MKLVSKLLNWVREDRGQTMAEYGLILALVSVTAIVALIVLGPNIRDIFQGIADNMHGL